MVFLIQARRDPPRGRSAGVACGRASDDYDGGRGAICGSAACCGARVTIDSPMRILVRL